MRFQAGLQILLIIIAIVIIVTAIKPKLAEVQFNQDEVAQYLNALQKASLYNQTLQELLNRASGISSGDKTALNRFLPETLDATVVARDIKNIVERNSMLLLEIDTKTSDAATVASKGGNASEDGFIRGEALESEARQDLSATRFVVEVIGSYEQMKAMLADFERNSYPLRLVAFSFEAPSDSDLYHYSVELETYSVSQ